MTTGAIAGLAPWLFLLLLVFHYLLLVLLRPAIDAVIANLRILVNDLVTMTYTGFQIPSLDEFARESVELGALDAVTGGWNLTRAAVQSLPTALRCATSLRLA